MILLNCDCDPVIYKEPKMLGLGLNMKNVTSNYSFCTQKKSNSYFHFLGFQVFENLFF